MDADPCAAPSRLWVRLYVFSLTVDWDRLGAEIKRTNDGRICVLTPHHLFPIERERVAALGASECEFRTFHDLLNQADMEYCDTEADRLVAAAHGGRRDEEDLVAGYYAALAWLKNQRATERLCVEFEVSGGVVLCGDLGIVPSVWRGLGLEDRSPPVTRSPSQRWSQLRRIVVDPVPCHYLEWNEERWLLVGRPERVGQYLEGKAVVLCPVGRATELWLNFQLLLLQKLNPESGLRRAIWRMLTRPWRRRNRRVTQLAATIHEHSVALAGLAGVLGLDYVNLQDSFLPGYYPSRYLLYRPQVRRFYVWDNFSHGIFKLHGLESVFWEAYRSWALPLIDPAGWKPVRRVVYLASGAGDWTALKNRSDEDLALTLLVEVARLRPDLTIYYRPHPLWLHPEHQGSNSIERVVDCLASFAPPNILVSQGARKDGRKFAATGNLSAVSSSVEEDIEWADLVLGEHSQTMLVAARRGKVIASLNVSKHPPYFGDYARIGFPLVSSTQEMAALIERMDTAGPGFLAEYNVAIARHNLENCGVRKIG